MPTWDDQLRSELAALESTDQLRSLAPRARRGRHLIAGDGQLLDFASNDYLALADHPHLKEAAIRAIRDHGTGSAASRLVSGHSPQHEKLEQRFAAFKHAGAALLFPTGYMANLAVAATLPQRGDLICLDKRNHASIIDAARASAADLRAFNHLDYDKLERLLRSFREQNAAAQQRAFIITDSVFSMDGDVADLPRLCDLAEAYDAITIIDEAHATGVLGARGSGLAEAQGVCDRIDITVSTAGKALGGLGGIVTASRPIIDTLINRARTFIYTTAVPPAQIAALDAALDIVEREPDRRERVRELAACLRNQLVGWASCPAPRQSIPTPIIPLILGESAPALTLAQHLQRQGILAPAIRPPTVPVGTARLRFTVRADMTDADLDQLIAALDRHDNPNPSPCQGGAGGGSGEPIKQKD